jgi:hypothetical protein
MGSPTQPSVGHQLKTYDPPSQEIATLSIAHFPLSTLAFPASRHRIPGTGSSQRLWLRFLFVARPLSPWSVSLRAYSGSLCVLIRYDPRRCLSTCDLL